MRKHAAVLSSVDDRRPWSSLPARRLPPAVALPVELLSYIFLLGFDNGIDPSKPFKRRELEAEPNFEVLVSHVCRRWREVAVSTPALWTGIRLRKPAHLERAAVFVVRSRNQLLDILLDTVAEAEYEPGLNLGIGEFDAGFRAAIAHTNRWRSLIVKVCDLPCKERARANLRDCPSIPKLETLQLWHVQDWTDASNMLSATSKPPIPILGDEVPSLLNASLVGVNLAYPQTHYLKGLRQFELALHAEFCRPSSAEFEAILRACPDLERLSLHYSGPRVDGTSTGAPVRLEKLVELALTNMDVDVLAHVIRRVAMPNLRALELELPALQDGLELTSVVDWLSMPSAPAFPRLESLSVADLACAPGSWARWLAGMPEITHLQVNFGAVGEPFFTPLVAPVASAAEASAPETVAPPSPSSPAPPPPDSSSPAPDAHPNTIKTPILLPNLANLKVSGLPSAHLRELAAFRTRAGYPVPHFTVHIRSVDTDTDQLQEEDGFGVSYFGIEEAAEEEEEGSEDEEDGEYSDEEDEVNDREEEEGAEGDDLHAATRAEGGGETEEGSPGETHVGEDLSEHASYDSGYDDDEGYRDHENDDDDDDDEEQTHAGSDSGYGLAYAATPGLYKLAMT